MPNTPTIYSSADVDAPELNETAGIAAGSLNALIKAIVVDGYGDKVAAGWTLTDTGTSTYGFLTGSGSSASYLIVEDLGDGANISSAKSITSLEPTVGTLVTTEQGLRKTNGTGARAWWAMASSRYIYLFLDTGDTGWFALSLFAGDLNSMKPLDDEQFMVAADYSGNYNNGSRCRFFTTTYSANDSVSNGYSTIIKSAFGDPSVSCGILRPFDAGGSPLPVGGGNTEYFVTPNPASVGYLFSVCCVLDGFGTPRGFLPNAYFPWHQFPLNDGDLRDLGSINIICKSFDIDENGSFGEGGGNDRGQIWLDYESSF